jgi:hypothetical protein
MSGGNLADGIMKNFIFGQIRLEVQTETLSGEKSLTKLSPSLLMLDPGGAGRDINLPAVADSVGLVFFLSNEADGAEVLTVKEGATTIVTPTQDEACILWCDGTSWSGLVGNTS